ncbi:MAG: hypothetical protein FWG90_12905 [Oscillospiraceae bacterium]|nr:hypothetical protein [Oscillospiraceae bacterium]
MDNDNQIVSVGEWIVALIVLGIPVVGIIMMFVWAFSSPKKSKANFCKAALVMAAVSILLSILFYSSILATLLSLGEFI